MSDPQMAISKHIVRRLGEDGLREVLASLYPVDCQTCNRPLAGSTVALVVTDMMTFAEANLHHRGCRKSEWQDSGIIRMVGEATLSHRMRTGLMPWTHSTTGEVVQQPVFLLNPGLECVLLVRADDQWRVRLPNQYTAAGLRPTRAGAIVDQPVTGAVVRLAADGVAVTLENEPVQTFVCPADSAYREQVKARGGVLLVVTHAVEPTQLLPDDDPLALLNDPRTVAGWVPLADKRPAQPAPQGRKAGVPETTYVLHHSPRHQSVGLLLAHTTEHLDADQAQRWAQPLTGRNTIGWQPTPDAEADNGWFTVDFITVNQFLLRRYPDGWRLVRGLSRVDGGAAQTDTEARYWADRVIKHKTQLSGLRWQPGPTPEGAVTQYATT